MSTIVDVAKHAGVSKSLVSLYLNGKDSVGSENRKKIEKSIAELNYRRNDMAASLIRGKTETIGVIINQITQSSLFDLYNGLETGGQEHDYKVLYCDCQIGPEHKKKYIDYFSRGHADGLIFFGSLYNDYEILYELTRLNYPFVLVGNNTPDIDTNKILIDNKTAMHNMVSHLYGKGYRDIRHIFWYSGNKTGLERYDGFCSGMASHGLEVSEKTVYFLGTNNANEDQITELINYLIDNNNLPDALVFSLDSMAFTAIKALIRRGVSIPGDVAVTGFDNEAYAGRDCAMPILTTLAPPMFQIGTAAVRLLNSGIQFTNKPKEVIVYQADLLTGTTT